MPEVRGGRLWNFVAVPGADGWAVFELVMNVPVDLAACVHPRFVLIDSGHCVPNRSLWASTQWWLLIRFATGHRG